MAEVSTLIQQLQHPDEAVRTRVFAVIASSYDSSLHKVLSQMATPDKQDIELLFCKYLQNMPSQIALRYLKRLVRSPNRRTRKEALNTLSGIDINHRVTVMIEFLSFPEKENILFALKELSENGKDVAIEYIASLLISENGELREAAFLAVELMNSPRSVRFLMPLMRAENPDLQVAAILTLGRMSCFRNWKIFFRILSSGRPEVRKAAVVNIARRGDRHSFRRLLPLIEKEDDEEILKLVVSLVSLKPSREVCRILIRTAYSHSSRQIRRTADWVLEEIEMNLLTRSLNSMLKDASEEATVYILKKMGRRQLANTGKHIAACLQNALATSTRIAALEALGNLGKLEFLPHIVPYFKSDDPMEAYISVMAANRIITRIEECPALLSILRSKKSDHDILKQVILQFLTDSVAWSPRNQEIIEILMENLSDENINIRYFAVILLGDSGRKEIVPKLASIALKDHDDNIRSMACDALDKTLKGDLRYLLVRLSRMNSCGEEFKTLLEILAGLVWNQESSQKAVGIIGHLVKRNEEEWLLSPLEKIARKVCSQCPIEVQEQITNLETGNIWRYTLAVARIESIGKPHNKQERESWRKFFHDDDKRIKDVAIEHAIKWKADWAVDDMLTCLYRSPSGKWSGELRQAVNMILGV